MTLAAFRHTIFRSLWFASVFSNTGGMIQLVAASWLMTLLTTSDGMVALVQTSVTLPMTLFSIVAGVLADNYDRRLVMLASQVLMLTLSIALAVLAIIGVVTPWLLLACTFGIGIGMAVHNPSWQASFTDLVPRADLPSATTLNAMGMNITRSVGPSLGGLLVALFGPPVAFVINTFTYLAFIAALAVWKPNYDKPYLPRESFGGALGAGMRYFLLSPNLINISTRGFLFGFAAIAMQALLPLVVRDLLDADAFIYGIMLGAFGFGAVVGALAAARIRSRLTNEVICRLGFAIFAVSSFVVAWSDNAILTSVAIVLGGISWINVNSLLNVTVQMSAPRWVLGRMIALFMAFVFGGMAIGSWAWGLVSEQYGLQLALSGAAVLLLVGIPWGFRFPVPQYGDVDLSPLNRFVEPSVKLDLHRRSGPINIEVEYEIAQEDVDQFLAAMAMRRRIRLRDGARRWSLLRDIERPCIWVESYLLPTWTEYLRHADRRTKVDDEVTQKVASLHRGPLPLRVRRMIERQTVIPHDDAPPLMVGREDYH
jgi:MFS family permease